MKYKVTTATEALQVFDMLGIKDITTDRQRKNGTTVYELPIQQMYQSLIPKPLRFACYRSGYVRNVSEYNTSAYQINKTKQVEYKSGMTGVERILIPNWEDRLIYLAKFIIKNYYQKPTYLISDWTMNTIRAQYKQANDLRNQTDTLPFDDVEEFVRQDLQVIINGHRYNLS